MSPPTIISSFLSVQPLEPVLVFTSADDAAYFQSHCKQGRILPDQARWVYLPMPEGLQRVRAAMFGDVAYEFDSHRHAEAFNKSIKDLGKTFPKTMEKPDMDRKVYLGRRLK